MTPEDDWIRSVEQTNAEIDRARRIQPGRGYDDYQSNRSDWWILGIVVLVLIASVFS